VSNAKGGDLTVNYRALNSKLFCCDIRGRLSIHLGARRYSEIHLKGDNYPDFEAYQYGVGSPARRLAYQDVGKAGVLGIYGIKTTPMAPDRNVTFVTPAQ
jgi:hypothetical protein